MVRLFGLALFEQRPRYVSLARDDVGDRSSSGSTELSDQSKGLVREEGTEVDIDIDIEKENQTSLSGCPSIFSGIETVRIWVSAHLPAAASSSLKNLVYTSFLVLVPSFLLPKVNSGQRRHATAWLDGLRGTAAFFVLFHHGFYAFFPSSHAGWGSTPAEENRWFFQLPFIRIVHSGIGMVCIFFIVSGFALSYKPLKLIRNGETAKLLDTLASSVFRRWMRLYLPIMIVTFIEMIVTRLNLYGHGPGSRPPPWANSASDQVWHWATTFRDFADPFRPVTSQNFSSPYDANLWTIPQEFQGSMVVFLTALALAKTHGNVRLLFTTCLTLYCFYYAYSNLCLFLSGMVLAELRFIREGTRERSQPNEDEATLAPPTPQRSLRKIYPLLLQSFWMLNFLAGIYLASAPDGTGDSPGFKTLSTLIPGRWGPFKYRFLPSIGAIQIVLAIDNLRLLQCIFTTTFAQYLGRISFSLYMVHGPIIYTFGWYIMAKTGALTGEDTQFRYGLGRALGALLLIPFLFWVADVVTRLVDEKCVSFAKWFSTKCFIAD